ncbi:major capsid protein P2 [Roseateles sp. So40a]|uniref:major capsid protein P2 n=1 Tax=Roseateles sp. So40a TaxID=3400226 RepID=UPI003A8B1E5D
MLYLDLPPFNPVANSVRSTTQVQRWAMSLGRVLLCFPQATANGIGKSTITEIVVKVGARVVFGPISGAELDRINKYRGIYDDAGHLTIDLTERDGLTIFAKEVGAIDIPGLGDEDIFIEVVNNYAGANPLSLYAVGGFTGLQFRPGDKSSEGQLIHKVLAYQIPTSGGTAVTWMPDFKGAFIKRIHFVYTGTDWTATADGNLQRVEAKKNGNVIWSRIRCLDNRFIQQEQRKVPQSRIYTLDWVHDNVNSSALDTRDARALEFNLTLGAADTVRAIVEVVDLPRNL